MTEVISLETASQICDLVNQLPPEQARQLLPQLKQEQPALYSYLVGLGRKQARASDGETILAVGIALWQIVKQGTGRLGRVSAQTLDRAERTLGGKVKHLAATPEPLKKNGAAQLVMGHPQPYVLAWLYVSMRGGDPHAPLMDREAELMGIYSLQVMLDAMLASLEGEGQKPEVGGQKSENRAATVTLAKPRRERSVRTPKAPKKTEPRP